MDSIIKIEPGIEEFSELPNELFSDLSPLPSTSNGIFNFEQDHSNDPCNIVKQEIPSDDDSVPSTSNGIFNNELPHPSDLYNGIKQENPSDDDSSDLDDFYFETDHPALKDNRDYKKLLRAVCILQAQRARAIRDLDVLHKLQEEALADPISFVNKLQKGKVQVPAPQEIYKLPVINWSKYALSSNAPTFGRRQPVQSVTKFSHPPVEYGSNERNQISDSKSKVSQWTSEEQKKLEELLIKFPPEKIEARRWEKIANCLKNRTPIQVASRVQKYFIKLTKSGIPVPGRAPNPAVVKKKARRKIIRSKPSTFLVSHEPPVYMPEDENDFVFQPHSTSNNSVVPKVEISDDEDLEPGLQNSEEYEEIMLIKKILRDREKSTDIVGNRYIPQSKVTHRQPSNVLASHHLLKTNENSLKSHISCCKCNQKISGTIWHCTECKTSVNFCTDCAVGEYKFGLHTSEHHLEAIKEVPSTVVDQDYRYFRGNDYNYLDPNYMPVTED